MIDSKLFPLVAAVLWLVFVWLWKKTGLKSEKGLKFIGIGAAWLLFFNAFMLFSEVLAMEGGHTIMLIGQWVGGTLAWLFGFLGALFLVIENFKK